MIPRFDMDSCSETAVVFLKNYRSLWIQFYVEFGYSGSQTKAHNSAVRVAHSVAAVYAFGTKSSKEWLTI